MKPKHWTLNATFSTVAGPVWAIVVVAVVALSSPHPWLPAVVGGICGALVGRFQSLSLAEAPASFVAAESALSVRAVLRSTPSGRRALWIQWLSLVPIVGTALLQPANAVAGALAGYFALMCVRDLLTAPATRRLASNANADTV